MRREMYEEMHRIENTHWWFRAKRDIVDALLQQLIGANSDVSLVDFGCGCGAMIDHLQVYGQPTGIDCSDIALAFCRERFQGELIQLNLEDSVPDSLKSRFDIGLALDVLEHIDGDLIAAMNMRDMIKDDGKCIITVPAHQWLWTYHDVNCMHKRRYNKKNLKELLERAGFSVDYISYYNCYLFPPALCVRLLSKALKLDKDSQMENKNDDSLANRLFYRIFASERKRIVKYKKFPFGLSLIAVVTKDHD